MTKNLCFFTKFRYQAALTSTTTTPCTNVPIVCTLPNCSKSMSEGTSAIRKYNIIVHMQNEHPGYDYELGNCFEGRIQLPDDMIASMFITDDEEEMIRIPKDNIPFKLVPTGLSSSQSGL